jgi:hypothetical protein
MKIRLATNEYYFHSLTIFLGNCIRIFEDGAVGSGWKNKIPVGIEQPSILAGTKFDKSLALPLAFPLPCDPTKKKEG